MPSSAYDEGVYPGCTLQVIITTGFLNFQGLFYKMHSGNIEFEILYSNTVLLLSCDVIVSMGTSLP
jgi:hypothetical protein